ncbi:MAG TPA: VWA domain-containing protein [Gemmatimonadaceae bacterium]|nr:VWA domain-containing protein [Gemmatimonadaceae bacterium]
MNLRFDVLWALYAAAVLPLASLLTFWLWHRRRVIRLARLGGEAAIVRLAPAGARRAPVARALRVSSAIGLAMLAFAGPRWGTSTSVVRTEGIDVVLAMDASLSMLAEDERPNRLERMKQEVRRFRATSRGDRMALLAFAGRSYILSPLTGDDGALELFLDNLDPSVVGQAGTALAPTIVQGVDLLRAARGAAGRALVILSDGEAFDDPSESLAAARRAREGEIAVVTVGFGTEGGSTIPIRAGGRVTSKRDATGNVVVTRYDPTLLRNIADAAGGEFIAADETDKGTRIRQALARVDARQRDVAEGLSRPLQLTWFLLPAFLLLMFDAWRADGGSLQRLRRALHLSAPLLLVVTIAGTAGAQTDADAMAHYKAAQYLRAAQLWRREIANGDKRPATLFNFGSAMLAADSLEPAVQALERAALSPEAAIRQRALYNLGLAQLRRGLHSDAGDQRPLEESIAAYRTLLLQRPDDADAKWNYELALRARKQQNGGGGGGKQNQPQQPQQRSQVDESKSMSRQQAEQLLSSAARDERESQSRRQRGTKQERPPGGKDW